MPLPSKLATAVGLSFASLTFSPRPAVPDTPDPDPAKVRVANVIGKEEKDFQAAVDKAIDRGVEWLKSIQNKDGSWVSPPPMAVPGGDFIGEQALAILTLAKCGMNEKDPEIVKALKALDRLFISQAGPKLENARSYDMAFTVLCYQAVYDRGGAPKARIRQIVEWFEKKQEKNVWRYPSEDHSEDLSVTQCVLLSLEMASRLGIKAKPEVYNKALEYLLREQEQTGPEVTLYTASPEWKAGSDEGLYGTKVKSRGFHYSTVSKSGTKGSMTAGGVGSLAIVKSQLKQLKALTPEKERAIDAAMLSGLAWLGENFSVEKNPTADLGDDTTWRNYYFYGVERAGMILGIPNMGKHDWYREMAQRLLIDQREDGSWYSSGSRLEPRIDTCLALLVLKRGTTPPVVSVKPPVTTTTTQEIR